MAKKLTKTVDVENSTVTLEVAGVESPIVASLAALPEAIRARLALHGLSQKLGDRVADKDCVGETAHTMLKGLLDQLTAGNWGVERSSGGAKIALFIEAIARLRNLSIEEVTARLDALNDDQLKAVKSMPDVKAMVDIIKAEKAKAVIASGESTLADLI